VDVPDRYVPFLDVTNPVIGEFVAMSMPGAEHVLRARLILPGLPKLTGGTYQGLELDADVHRVAQAADPASNTFRVELRLPNPAEALKQGMIAQARIEYLHYPAAILIPLKAIQVADVGPRVLVVTDADGVATAQVRNIEPVSISGDQVLVAQGLQAGDQLVVAGGKGVMNGERVNVIMRDGVLQNNGP
jgi:multidrug efflux pump subunit AcrA (membrane-fusion protein)